MVRESTTRRVVVTAMSLVRVVVATTSFLPARRGPLNRGPDGLGSWMRRGLVALAVGSCPLCGPPGASEPPW
jgi:hypothetical protein